MHAVPWMNNENVPFDCGNVNRLENHLFLSTVIEHCVHVVCVLTKNTEILLATQCLC